MRCSVTRQMPKGSVRMTMHKLARELEETARQSAAMADGVTQALELLADDTAACAEARKDAARMIVMALQGQDRIEQRCRNMAHAVRRFGLLPPDAPASDYEEIWSALALDELRVASLSGVAAHGLHGEVELF